MMTKCFLKIFVVVNKTDLKFFDKCVEPISSDSNRSTVYRASVCNVIFVLERVIMTMTIIFYFLLIIDQKKKRRRGKSFDVYELYCQKNYKT